MRKRFVLRVINGVYYEKDLFVYAENIDGAYDRIPNALRRHGYFFFTRTEEEAIKEGEMMLKGQFPEWLTGWKPGESGFEESQKYWMGELADYLKESPDASPLEVFEKFSRYSSTTDCKYYFDAQSVEVLPWEEYKSKVLCA